MSFDDTLILPESISLYRFRGKRMRRTEIVETFSGYEQRNVAWSKTRRTYDAGMVARPVSQWVDLDTFFELTDGAATGFRVKDPTDYLVTAAQGLLYGLDLNSVNVGTIGTGRGVPTFQLYKRYTLSGGNHDREIRKPISASATIYRNGSPVTVGSGAGQIAINYNTGVVTFQPDVAAVGIDAITVGATTIVELASAIGTIGVGDWLYVSGLTGADAATMNGKSFEVAAIESNNVYELDVDTSGLTITRHPATSAAYQYPQPDDALTWAGQFHVPCRFATDELDWEVVDRGDELLVEGPSIPIIEIRF